MISPEDKQHVLAFLKDHKLCVIATIHQDKEGPESAVVGFVETDILQIAVGTSNTSRKYQNIQKNSHVSLVIGWDSDIGTLQYEGTAAELPLEEAKSFALLQAVKNPSSRSFIERPDQRYFLITPTWFRLLDFSVSPPHKIEETF